MAKKVKAIIKLQIPAGQANPAPPVGPALRGARRVCIGEVGARQVCSQPLGGESGAADRKRTKKAHLTSLASRVSPPIAS